MVGVVTIGLASIFDSTAFPHDTVWSRFGAGYGYVPIILPVLGLMWLWQTRDQQRVSRRSLSMSIRDVDNRRRTSRSVTLPR